MGISNLSQENGHFKQLILECKRREGRQDAQHSVYGQESPVLNPALESRTQCSRTLN